MLRASGARDSNAALNGERGSYEHEGRCEDGADASKLVKLLILTQLSFL